MAPRAVFVAAHHATLPRRLPGGWAALLGAVQALLQRGLTDQSSKVWLPGPRIYLLISDFFLG